MKTAGEIIRKDPGRIIIRVIMVLAVLIASRFTPLNAQDLQSAIKLQRSEQFNKADPVFRQVIKEDPSESKAYYYFGENWLLKYFSDTLSYSLTSLADSASRIFHSGISADPAEPLNYVGLGEIDLLKKNRTSAQTWFDKALSMLPTGRGKSDLPKKDQGEVLISLADAFLKAHVNDTSVVFPLFRRAESLDKSNDRLYLASGDAYVQILNDGSSAIECYKRAQELDPGSLRAKLKLGILWEKARNYDDAVNYLADAIKNDSDYAPAYRELGTIYSKTNQDIKAKESFAKFLALSSGNRESRIQYINILFELQEYPVAIDQLNAIMKKDSSINDLNRGLGYAYYETGQYAKGLYYMKKFLDNAATGKIKTMDYSYYGKLLEKNGRDSLAGEFLVKAYSMDTSQSELLIQALNDFIRTRDYGKAAEVMVRKIMMHHNVPNDYYILGKLYYNRHEYQKADSVFSINIALDPGNVKGYLWKAYSLVNLDPDSKEGLARPAFEMLVEKARSDSVKYSADLKDAYSYLAFYHFRQFLKTRKQEDAVITSDYCDKVLAIDPGDEKAKTILKDMKELSMAAEKQS